MKRLATAALTLAMLAAPTLAFAQQYNNDGWMYPAPDSATSPMHGSHDKGAIVRELNNNGINGRTNHDRSDYMGYYNPHR